MIQDYAFQQLDVPNELTSYYEGVRIPNGMKHLKHLTWLSDDFDGMRIKGLKSLRIEHMFDFNLKKLEGFKSLTYLDILKYSYLRNNLSSLSSLPLETLKLNEYNCEIGDISNLKNLKCLELDEYDGDLSDLSSLEGLTSLSLARYTEGEDLSPLSSLTSLTYLNLGSFNGDISPLSSLTSLKKLSLGLFDGDLSVLKDLPLEELELENYTDGDLSFFKGVKIYAPEHDS